ncbi:TetR/AcrR family transcriptional regulator [Nocardia abscessus]|uniref:TetR/AcrR family transcriptional regulator n=1 Tax=Nocardia abscessus TaxID=120957 RepID=UPI0024588EF5|nr:TetR/AcrR family transcriptional regulator [Nocardia abscessus]
MRQRRCAPARCPSPTRAQQRRNTEARILAAAGRLFAEIGYDRTTIRAVATEADTDPSLVMRYFGSKENLFARVAVFADDHPVTGTPEHVAELLLDALAVKLADQPVNTLAAIRSMLTHPDAAAEVRAAMTARQREAAGQLADDEADLRAGLLGALTIGVVIGRHLLELDGLRDAPPQRIIALLRNAFHDIAHGPAESETLVATPQAR